MSDVTSFFNKLIGGWFYMNVCSTERIKLMR